MFGNQVMVENVEHQIFVSEEFDLNLFLLWSWFDERSSLFINGNAGDFSFAISSTDDEKLFDVWGDSDEVFYFILRDCLRIWCILFGVEVHYNTIFRGLAFHGIFIFIFLLFIDDVKGLFLSAEFDFIFCILFKSHVFMIFLNSVASGLHDFEYGFVDFEIFSFGISFVFFELLLHCIGKSWY